MFLGADTIRPLLRQLVPEAEVITRPRFSDPDLYPARQGHAAAAAQRRGRIHRAGGLRARRAGAPPARRCGGRARRAQPAHAQRPGRPLPGRRGRLPDRDRCDRHGAQHGPGPRRARQPEQVRRPRAAAARTRTRSPRSPAAPAATCRTAPSAPRTMSAGSTRRPSRRSRATISRRSSSCAGAAPRSTSASLDGLLDSLEAPPPAPCLLRTGGALDHVSLKVLARRDRRCATRAATPAGVRLLWAVCQIPDFRKTLTEAHLQLLDTVFGHLAERRPAADRLGRRSGGAPRAHRRRHRHADRAARAHPHLDLRRPPRRLAARRRATGRSARARSRTR